MGDDAEYYSEQQEEEKRHQEIARQERDDQIAKKNIEWEKASESENKDSSNKD